MRTNMLGEQMVSLKRSMDPVNSFILSSLIVVAVFGVIYLVYDQIMNVEKSDLVFDKPMEEQVEISDKFMGETMIAEDSATKVMRRSWGYSGSIGPATWGDLHSDYKLCRDGKRQSPVNITRDKLSSKLLPLRFYYREADVALKNTSNTLKAEYEDGSYAEVDGIRFDLIEFVFHSPSEHRVDDIPYDMEIQLLHENSQGERLVLAIFVEEGRANKSLGELWKRLPERKGDVGNAKPFNALSLLPSVRTYYSYSGSSTTPPCEQDVRWLIFTRPIQMSKSQVDQFLKIIRYNARPIQPLGARTVYRSRR